MNSGEEEKKRINILFVMSKAVGVCFSDKKINGFKEEKRDKKGGRFFSFKD
mgnify:CR=1 FL=1